MYKLYCAWCTEKLYTPVKEWCYRQVFNTQFNLSFHRPHTDTCNKCDTFAMRIAHETDEQLLAQLKAEQELHQRRAQKAKDQKKLDIQIAKDKNNIAVFTFDLQKTLPTPSLTSNKVYYMRVLWTYNLGIHNLKTGKSTMFMWGENVASRGSQEIGSCLKKYCEGLSGVSHVVAYSDCCGGQNRNKNVLNIWMHIVKTSVIQVIDHKFLEPGHTYMECDQDFGLIEKRKRVVNNAFVVEDWINIVKATSKHFTVIQMKGDDFFSIEAMNKLTMTSVTKDEEGKTISWHNVRWLRVEKTQPLIMFFKETLNEDLPFRKVSFKKRETGRPSAVTLSNLHPDGVPIKAAKYKNLQELKPLIPPVHHTFYDNLPHQTLPVPNRRRGRPPAAEKVIPEVSDSSDDSELSSD